LAALVPPSSFVVVIVAAVDFVAHLEVTIYVPCCHCDVVLSWLVLAWLLWLVVWYGGIGLAGAHGCGW
jgi:hypothetical protein